MIRGGISLRARLLSAVVALDLLAALVTGTVVIVTSRSASMLEIASTMNLASELVNEAVRSMQDSPAALILQTLQLQFATVRHVRVAVFADNGRQEAIPTRVLTAEQHAPRWFAALIRPPQHVENVPLLVHNRKIGDVQIAADPEDEIAEAWQFVEAILITGLVLNLIVFALLLLVFARMLKPLTELARGLEHLEERIYAVRLEKPALPELAAIARHFNAAAAAIETEQQLNRALSRQLLKAQDDERRQTALELHDEMGPCLFALDVAGSSLMSRSKLIDEAKLREGAEQVVSLIGELKRVNRQVLARLRPASLGRLPLDACLRKLVGDLTAGGPHEVSCEIGALATSYGGSIDLTLYRAIQESLVNAKKHARATRLEIQAGEETSGAARRLVLAVRDNGQGMTQNLRSGLGLAGLQERTEALGGSFDLHSSTDGTRIRIIIPVEASQSGDALSLAAVGS